MKKLATMASLLLLAGCAPNGSVAPASSPLATPEVSLTATPSHGATACDPGVVCNGPLAAGDYVSETTGARIVFTLDAHDWSGVADVPGDGFSLHLADVPDAAISVVSFSGEIYTDACTGSATSTIGNSPTDLMEFLLVRHGVTAAQPTETEVGGRPALQMDLTTDLEGACMGTADRIWLWTLPVAGDFSFVDETARVIAVDGDTATVVIVIEALEDTEWDHFLEHGMELVESMTIGPPEIDY